MSHSLRVSLLALACFAGALAGHLLALPALGVSPFWPPAGLAVAALFLWGRRLWPGVALGVVAAALTHGESLTVSLGFGAAGTLAALTATYLLQQYRVIARLERPRDVVGFVVLGAFLPSLISASLGTLTLVLLTHAAAPDCRRTISPTTWRR